VVLRGKLVHVARLRFSEWIADSSAADLVVRLLYLPLLMLRALESHPMTIRFLVGTVALAGLALGGVLSAIVSMSVVEKVNAHLPEDQQFSALGWYPGKRSRLRKEYLRLYPQGDLLRKTNALGVTMGVCLFVCAWALGFFALSGSR